LIKITNPLPSIIDEDEIDEDKSNKNSFLDLHDKMNLKLTEAQNNHKHKEDS